MNEIIQMILSNFTTICLVLGFGIITLTNNSLSKRSNRFFFVFELIVLILIAADITESYYAGLAEPSFMRNLASAVSYTLRPASVAIMISILLRRKKASAALWAAVGAVGVIAFTSSFTHLMFWYSEENFFMRGPLGYISHILSIALLLILVVLTLKLHSSITTVETFAVLFSAFICIIATVFESKLSGYKFLINGAMMTSCALYYVVLYIETYRRDPLTGLLNRRSFYLDVRKLRSRTLAVVSFDLNELKQINDSQGHSAGDDALQCVGNAMLKNCTKKWTSYRTGGDEFILLGIEQNDQSVHAFIDTLRDSLKKDNLNGAFGYAFYKPGDDFDAICNQADAHMYDDKKHFKHREMSRSDTLEKMPPSAE